MNNHNQPSAVKYMQQNIFTLLHTIYALANKQTIAFGDASSFELPVMTSFLPRKLLDVQKRKADLKLIEHIFRLFPYLLKPQRVLNFSKDEKFGSKYLFSVEQVIRRDRLNANFLIKTHNDPSLADVDHTIFPNVVSSSEYLINLNGLERAVDNLARSLKLDIEFEGGINSNRPLFLEIRSRIVMKHHIQYFDKDNHFHILYLNGKYQLIPYKLSSKVGDLLVALGFNFDDKALSKMFSDKQKYTQPFLDISKEIKALNKVFNTNESVKKFIEQNANDERIESNFNKVFDWCDEYYDEAKQTGISYHQFQDLFFIYGPEIQQMTEKAYELMNETRDVDVIWEKVVKEVS